MNNIYTKIMVMIAVLFMPVQLVQAEETTLLDVKVRHDRKFDFSQITNNYQWVKRKDSSRDAVASRDPEINEYFLSIVNRKLSEKGYTEVYDDSASFGIDYELVIKSDSSEASLAQYSEQLRKSRYSKTNIAGLPNIEHWKQGTLILNIMDMKSGYLIWIGYAEALVVDKENREELLQQAVTQMLDQFPPE